MNVNLPSNASPFPLIGRENEVALFEDLLRPSIGTRHLLLFAGGPGVGKTYLLDVFRKLCSKRNIFNIWIDLVTENYDQIASDLNKQLAHYEGSQISSDIESSTDIDSLWDLPLFSKQPIISVERKGRSGISYQFNSIANQINEISHTRKSVIFVDASLAQSANIRRLFVQFLDSLVANNLIVLACRRWEPLMTFLPNAQLTRIELRPFSWQESISFLEAHGITDKEAQTAIGTIAQGVPLLLNKSLSYVTSERLAAERLELGLAQTLIDRTFQEVKDERVVELARTAAIMRHFNFESLQKLSKGRNIQHSLNQLREHSFLETDGQWLMISPFLRENLIKEWRANSPNQFVSLNKKALEYYTGLSLSSTGLSIGNQIDIEKIYHRLCIDEQKGAIEAIEYFVRSEMLLDIQACRATMAELQQFQFYLLAADEWSGFCQATISRLEYRWADSKKEFDDLIARCIHPFLRAHLLGGLSQTLTELGDLESAEQASKGAQEAFARSNAKRSRLTALLLLGNLLTRQHRWDEALGQLNKALTAASTSRDALIDFQIQFGLADLYRSQGHWDAAYEHLNQALFKTEEIGSIALQAQVWHSLGKLHRSRLDWNIAIRCYERSISLRERIQDRLGQAQSLHSLGIVYLRNQELESAQKLFQQSITIKESIGDKFGIAKGFNSLGHVLRLEGRIDEALTLYKRSLALLEELNNKSKLGRMMCRIGMTLAGQGQIEDAISYLQRSRTIRLKSSDRQGVAETLYELALIYEQSGDLPTARESFSLSLKFATDSNSLTRELAPTVQLAIMAYRDGDTKGGSNLMLRARTTAQKSKQHNLLVALYLERAQKEFRAHQLVGAFLCCAEAAYMAAHEDDRIVSTVLNKTLDWLAQIETTEGELIVQDFARRILTFWCTQCEPPEQKTHFWARVASVDTLPASRNGKSALALIKVVYGELEVAN